MFVHDIQSLHYIIYIYINIYIYIYIYICIYMTLNSWLLTKWAAGNLEN